MRCQKLHVLGFELLQRRRFSAFLHNPKKQTNATSLESAQYFELKNIIFKFALKRTSRVKTQTYVERDVSFVRSLMVSNTQATRRWLLPTSHTTEKGKKTNRLY